ncbi:threonine/serine dehydratase [Aliamphritea ceti]|uniref:threonine/serine dehydratase n=1 Tax=Aliamphritea ceti TaxID=1524258 RepID=UPI0021C2E0D1|nr:threonine/serine dehydratase [Aliamphritea ceti]
MNSKDVSPDSYVSLQTVLQARDRIASIIRPTPLIFSSAISEAVGCEVWLKLETLQTTGSFKLRGASNRMLQLSEAEKKRGVVAVSSGNHGRAVAYIAKILGIRAIICVCDLVPENKRQAIRSYGADLRVVGNTQDDAQEYADSLIDKEGLTWIAPYDDLDVIAGQGTIALDILNEQPDIDTIIAPLSGGGLLSGIALAAKAISPAINVVGTSMEVEPGMVRSLEAGHPVTVEEPPSLGDAIGGSIGLNNQFTFPIVRDFMDAAILVSEESLRPAMQLLFESEGLVMEGGSASALAGALHTDFQRREAQKIAVVISGRNISSERFNNTEEQK